MTLIHALDFNDRQWYDAHLMMYNRDLSFHMGVDPRHIVNPPSLVDFFKNITAAIEAKMFNAWGILSDDGEFLGYVYLDKSTVGEWEVGTVIADPEKRNRGTGVQATLQAMKHVFEVEDSHWCVAFTQGKDPKVRAMLIRGGFIPFANYLVMDRPTWNERWAGRV